MARLARAVAPGIPHHVTQRGNRRQPTFLCEEDDQRYVELMAQFCRHEQVETWVEFGVHGTWCNGPLGAICSRTALVAPVNIWQWPKRDILHLSPV